MARKKENIEDLDEELEKLEAELRALEAGEDPAAEAAEEAPDEGSEATDEDPEKKRRMGGLLGKLPFGRGKDEPTEEAEEAEAGEAGEAGEAVEEPTEEPVDEPPEELVDEPPEEAAEGPAEAPDAPPEETTEAEDHPAPEAEEVEPPEEETSPLGTLIGKLRRGKGEQEAASAEETEAPEAEASPDEDAVEEPDPAASPEPSPVPEPLTDTESEREAEVAEAWRKRRSQDWEPAEEGGWRRRDPSQAPPEEDGRDEGRARALLARFRGSDDEEEERSEGPFAAQPAPEDEEDEEEDERRRKPVAWLWILIALLAVGLLAAAAFVLLGGDDGPLGGGQAPTAAVAAPAAVTTAEGTPVASVGRAFTLDASGSTGEIDEYVWAFGDGETATTQEPTVEHTYTVAGTYEVTVTAVGEGGEGQATLEVLAVQAPVAQAEVLVAGSPVAAPGEVGNNAFLGQSVQLDASGSSADDQLALASYAWDINGDGQPDATGEQAEVTFSEVGAWTVNLTVTDELGVTASAEQVVHVANRFQFNDTLGAALAGATSNEHPFTAGEGREDIAPVQVSAVLTYTPPAGVQEDLDLVLVDPEGNEFEATEDDGDGEETITLTQGDLAALGDWTARVTHEQGGLQEIDYGLVIEVFY